MLYEILIAAWRGVTTSEGTGGIVTDDVILLLKTLEPGSQKNHDGSSA